MPKKVWTTADIPDQTGKIALVTGGTGGLGYETSLALAQAGATVIVGGRNEEKGKIALQKIREVCPQAKVEFGNVDQGSLDAIAKFATNLSAKYSCLDILINNAGIMTPPDRLTTSDGFEIQFGTNHLSHFALTSHLLPLLRKSVSPRVVNVSSIAHRQGKINFADLQSEKSYGLMAYPQSKLANLLFTFELQRRSDDGGWGLMCNAAHPGYSRTDLVANGPKDGFMVWGVNTFFKPLFSQSAADGALPQLFAATSPEAKGHGYYGPNGFYEMKGHVSPAYVAPAAKDEVVAAKLWDVSTKLTGVTWP